MADRCESCRRGEPCHTCGRRRICEEHGFPAGVSYDSYMGGYEADGVECSRCHRKRESLRQLDETSHYILYTLEEGGYSLVLEWDGKGNAFMQDEDADEGPKRVSVAVVRRLIERGAIAPWRSIGYGRSARPYTTYRPAWWTAAWFRQHPEQTPPQPALALMASAR